VREDAAGAASSSGAPGAAPVLRVAVEGGGCSGFQYRFQLDGAGPAADDRRVGAAQLACALRGVADTRAAPRCASFPCRVFERDGARVAVDPVSFGFLKGATVDYSEELIRAAFTIRDNPNTEASCGCGSSFATKA
jgi:Fe-S cluster assembly iron-binding protein IscA